MQAKRSSEQNLSEKLNRKYPYVTAYIGLIALLFVAGIAAGFIVAIPGLIFSPILSDDFAVITSLLRLILQVVIGYYAFRFVVRKNVLPFI